MSGFGRISWGLSYWGASSPQVQTAIPEPFVSVGSGHVFGKFIDPSREDAVFSSLESLRDAIFSSDASSSITNSHVVAFIKATETHLYSGSPVSRSGILRDKSWAPVITPFQRDIIAGSYDISAFIKTNSMGNYNLRARIGAIAPGIKDLPGFIHGFYEDNIGAFLRATLPGQDDISAFIRSFSFQNLPAFLQPYNVNDLFAILGVASPEDLPGILTSIPPYNLPSILNSIPGVDLGAVGGGHFPEDILAFLSVTQPIDLSAYIRSKISQVQDLTSTLNQIGQIQDIGASIKNVQSLNYDINARLRVLAHGVYDLATAIHGFAIDDLSAFIGVFHTSDIRSILYGYVREATSDVSAIIRRTDTGVLDLSVGLLRGLFSTFSTLSAAVTALDFTLGDIQAEIKGFFDGIKDFPTSVSSVSPFVNINKFIIHLHPLFNLPSSIIQAGGFRGLSAAVTPLRHAQTSTSEDARFTSQATDFKFYLGTTSGVFIPNIFVPRTITTTYINHVNLPDLHATLFGWNTTDLSASLNPYPSSDLSGHVVSYDISHLKDLTSFIQPLNSKDLVASLVPFGSFYGLSSSIISDGAIYNLSASIIPGIDSLSTSFLTISTKPYYDLGALINYDSFVRCARISTTEILTAYIKPLVNGGTSLGDIQATLNVLRDREDLSGNLEARKRTRIRLLNLEFRASIRDNFPIRASLTPVIPTTQEIAASILGISHNIDLAASLDVVRIAPHTVRFTPSERVVNLKKGSEKDIFVSFRNQVNDYVYETISNSVFPTDRGTWSIDLSTLLLDDSFFPISEENRSQNLFEVNDFYTLDEAIRAAIVILCERRQQNLSAQINAIGSVSHISATMTITSIDRFFNISSSLFPVGQLPDLSASINIDPGSSSFYTLSGFIRIGGTEVENNLTSQVSGFYDENLTASVTAIP